MKFFKPDVHVRCYTTTELGNVLDWLRHQYGLTGLSMRKFSVQTTLGSCLGDNPKEVLYFDVPVPHHLYARLKDEYLKAHAFDEVLLQEQVFKSIKDPTP